MHAFHQIAIPHRDIYDGNFNLEVYAAKLWSVFNDEGPEEYRDSTTFFKRTYQTKNLEKIVNTIKERLDGKSKDHFMPITTPFGGGKTHSLIYLYHKYLQWYGKKPVVIVGTEVDPHIQTIWGLIEEQLTGKIEKLTGQIPRGSTALREILKDHQPVLILIDELQRYIEKADGIKIENTTLADQTIIFIQELGEAVVDLPNVCIAVTLPSSSNEILNNPRYEELYEKLKKFTGRIEHSFSPIDDEDVPNIIRARLFQTNDYHIKDRAESIIDDFVDYCEEEGIIPEGLQPSQYRTKFESSYPFLPQVIDVLYERWGSMLNFQRTRGALRLLSIVTNALIDSDKEYISLGDFDLSNEKLRRELIRHLDEQFESVIAKDIVGADSGASKVDKLMPQQLWGKKLGTRTATSIFMYSHSGGTVPRGCNEAEIKRASTSRGIPSAQINVVLDNFRSQLFYLDTKDNNFLFTKEANILKIKFDIIENIKMDHLDEQEKRLLKENITDNKFRIIIWPSNSKDVEDSHSMKLVILKNNDLHLINSIYHSFGESTRIYKNNIFILVPSTEQKIKFIDLLKSKIAWEHINNDESLLSKNKSIVKDALKKDNESLKDHVKEYYSILYIPEKNQPREVHINIPLASSNTIDQIVYDYLKYENLINEQLGPMLIKKKYLEGNQYVGTDQLYETMLRTPGERRPVHKEVLTRAIKDGVSKGEFGLGELEGTTPNCKHFKEHPAAGGGVKITYPYHTILEK